MTHRFSCGRCLSSQVLSETPWWVKLFFGCNQNSAAQDGMPEERCKPEPTTTGELQAGLRATARNGMLEARCKAEPTTTAELQAGLRATAQDGMPEARCKAEPTTTAA